MLSKCFLKGSLLIEKEGPKGNQNQVLEPNPWQPFADVWWIINIFHLTCCDGAKVKSYTPTPLRVQSECIMIKM